MTSEPTRLAPLIRDTVSRCQSVYPDLQVHQDVPEALPVLLVDSTRIAQVLDNLLSNASKYAPGSQVTIRGRREDPFVRVDVLDSGPGIPPEHLHHLFERFYRVPGGSSTVRGTGLGLYICRKIVEAHGGEITAERRPARWYVLLLYLAYAPRRCRVRAENAHERQENDPDRR